MYTYVLELSSYVPIQHYYYMCTCLSVYKKVYMIYVMIYVVNVPLYDTVCTKKANTQTQNIDHKSLVENASGKASTANPKFASNTMFSPLSSLFARSFSSMDK